MRTLLTAILGLSLAACTVGGIGDDGDDGDDSVGDDGDDGDDAPPPPVPAVALVMTPDAPCAPTATGATCQGPLESTFSFTVTATASGGFSGPVAVAVNGLPANWESEILPAATIDLPVDGSGSATITVRVPPYGDAGQIALSITATSSLRAATYDVGTSILNEYTTTVTGGCDLPGVGARQGEPGAVNNPLRLKLGATFKIRNDTDHQVTIHSDNGGAGFPHQPDPGMGPGQTYTVTPDDTTANYEWYCHDPDNGQRSNMRLVD